MTERHASPENFRRAEYILNHYGGKSLADIELLGRALDLHDAQTQLTYRKEIIKAIRS